MGFTETTLQVSLPWHLTNDQFFRTVQILVPESVKETGLPSSIGITKTNSVIPILVDSREEMFWCPGCYLYEWSLPATQNLFLLDPSFLNLHLILVCRNMYLVCTQRHLKRWSALYAPLSLGAIPTMSQTIFRVTSIWNTGLYHILKKILSSELHKLNISWEWL